LQGQSPADIAATLRGMLVASNQQPELAGVFSTFAADTPQVYLDIDRNKAQVLGVKIADLFNALQSTIGRFYVNNFNVFGRTWQVNVQADTPFRHEIDDIFNVYVRNSAGAMVPVRVLAQPEIVQGPQLLVRYNGFRAALINGAPKPGFSSGQALDAMERVSDDAARRLWLRMDGDRAAGEGGRRRHVCGARACGDVRLSLSRRAL
jgi:HAE1 family hydrophobic/amphiphilic exporter-1